VVSREGGEGGGASAHEHTLAKRAQEKESFGARAHEKEGVVGVRGEEDVGGGGRAQEEEENVGTRAQEQEVADSSHPVVDVGCWSWPLDISSSILRESGRERNSRRLLTPPARVVDIGCCS
jgi:hypothetical protein